MKVEIDLGDFEYDNEDVQASMTDKIVSILAEKIKRGIDDRLTKAVDNLIADSVKNAVPKKVTEVMESLLDHEFTETTSWGEKKGTYTVRNRILTAIENQAVYKKESYSSDKNAFTKLVDGLVESKMHHFKSEISKEVDARFTNEAMAFAEKKIKERLGLK